MKSIVDKTKIIATIGPACSSKEILTKMIQSGLDVCRLNFSHGTHDDHFKVINLINEINEELGTNVAILADLQGPKIRIGEIENNEAVLTSGQQIIITTKKCIGNKDKLYLTYQDFPKDVKGGDLIQIDDGKFLLKVVSTNRDDEVKAEIIHGGILKSKKGVNLPNTKISLPSLTEKDFKDAEFAIKNNIQWIALSFVRSASDIIDLRHFINKIDNGNRPLIIAKIEKPEALADIDNIIRKADGIMVARGDLGIEIPMEAVPLTQKMLVKKCMQAAKPIIIATQMMEAMIDNFNPTRAEVNDVANAVMDGADALMLSGETSIGNYPVEVIKTMQKIINYVETYEDIYYKHHKTEFSDAERMISDSIIQSACELSKQVDAKAIIGLTHSGYSAFRIASQRPRANIFIFSKNRAILRRLSLVWGVRGYYYDKFISTDHTIEDVIYILRKDNYVKEGDLVIHVTTTPLELSGKTNMVKLSRV